MGRLPPPRPCRAGHVRIITRGGIDWTHRFPAIAAAALELGAGTAILDGEAVVLDEQGRSDYPALLRVLGGRGGKRIAPEAMFYVFDLLYLDGQDLRSGTLVDRRAALGTLLHGSDPAGWIRLLEEVDGDGGALLRHACAAGLEGIVAKDRRKPYRRRLDQGWTDALRNLHSDDPMFTFWAYERDRWSRDAGFRLDHLLVSPDLARRLASAGVDRCVQGEPDASDHAPAWIELR